MMYRVFVKYLIGIEAEIALAERDIQNHHGANTNQEENTGAA